MAEEQGSSSPFPPNIKRSRSVSYEDQKIKVFFFFFFFWNWWFLITLIDFDISFKLMNWHGPFTTFEKGIMKKKSIYCERVKDISKFLTMTDWLIDWLSNFKKIEIKTFKKIFSSYRLFIMETNGWLYVNHIISSLLWL